MRWLYHGRTCVRNVKQCGVASVRRVERGFSPRSVGAVGTSLFITAWQWRGKLVVYRRIFVRLLKRQFICARSRLRRMDHLILHIAVVNRGFIAERVKDCVG